MNIKKLANKIICGDCLSKLKYIPDESIDLVYLDPPFFSNKNYEIVWGNGAELKAFGDRWKGSINYYIEWMTDRVREMHRILKPTGSIYLHCDKHANHHLRLMLDRVFGEKNFRNEIIWRYTKMNATNNIWIQNHDNIYFYTKSDDWYFKQQRLEEKSALYNRLSHFINDNNLILWKSVKNHKSQLMDSYIKSARNRLNRKLKDNDIIIDLTKKAFKKCDDVWYISIIKGNSKENLDYPTQKPEALLERIILASSKEGDIVLDPFMGGGTTCAVAKRLKRKYIGIDVSPVGCATTLKRLEGTKDIRDKLFKIIDYPATEDDLMKLSGLELQQWMMIQLHAKINPKLSDDGGIDGWFVDGTPIEVKKGNLTRGHVQKLHSAAITDNKQKAVLIGKSIPRTVWEKVSELKLEHDFEVIIMTLQQVIDRDFKVLLEAGIPVRDKTLQDYYRPKKIPGE